MKTKIITLKDIKGKNLSLKASDYIYDDSIKDVRDRDNRAKDIKDAKKEAGDSD